MYGIYGEHTQEACPLYNEQNRRWLLASLQNQEKTAQKHGVRISQQYHSALEHTFLWAVEAENAQLYRRVHGENCWKIQHSKNYLIDYLPRGYRKM